MSACPYEPKGKNIKSEYRKSSFKPPFCNKLPPPPFSREES